MFATGYLTTLNGEDIVCRKIDFNRKMALHASISFGPSANKFVNQTPLHFSNIIRDLIHCRHGAAIQHLGEQLKIEAWQIVILCFETVQRRFMNLASKRHKIIRFFVDLITGQFVDKYCVFFLGDFPPRPSTIFEGVKLFQTQNVISRIEA